MFYSVIGDAVYTDADALLIRVNCQGIISKNFELEVKLNNHRMNKSYEKACKEGRLKPGMVHHYSEDGKMIICMALQNRWNDKPQLKYLESCLDEVEKIAKSMHLRSIAVPPVGCEIGELDWNEVKQLVARKFKKLAKTIDIYFYELYYLCEPERALSPEAKEPDETARANDTDSLCTNCPCCYRKQSQSQAEE